MNQFEQNEYETQIQYALLHLDKAKECLEAAIAQLPNKGENGEALHHLSVIKETFAGLSSLICPGDTE